MKLYKSGGGIMGKRLVGEVNTPTELAELLIQDYATRFTYLSGTALPELKPGVVLAEKRPDGIRFTLEED